MFKLDFTQEDIDELNDLRFYHHDAVLAELLAEFEFGRAIVEIRNKTIAE